MELNVTFSVNVVAWSGLPCRALKPSTAKPMRIIVRLNSAHFTTLCRSPDLLSISSVEDGFEDLLGTLIDIDRLLRLVGCRFGGLNKEIAWVSSDTFIKLDKIPYSTEYI